MQSTTVRIDKESQKILREIAQKENESNQAILHKALESYYRHIFLKRCSDAYSALKTDDKAWKEELAEREAWDTAIDDGVEED
ncbi:MAG: toxin-antitoxin system protein [Pseudomonadota bacterium]|nr:toxin-antitoxin system protein [Gammaproteobacteria bacterium]